MTFSYTTSHDLEPHLKDLKPGAFLASIDALLTARFHWDVQGLTIDEAGWVEDVAAHAVKYAFRRGAPRPGISSVLVAKDGRCRVHFQFIPDEVAQP